MRSARRAALILGAVCCCLPAIARAATDDPSIAVPGADRPEVLDRIGDLPGMTAVALSPDATRAVTSSPSTEKRGYSEVRFHDASGSEPRTKLVRGIVRDLLFDRTSDVVYALVHRPAKRREGETELVRIELATMKIDRGMRLPPSARALDHWITGDAMLIAAQDELRTILLPAMRSGRLFRIPGANQSLASIGGGSLVLTGQERSLLLVDLSDPPGEEQMPIRARIDTPAPVAALAMTADGSGGLARLEDGSLWSISFPPLRLERAGTAQALAAPPAVAPATAAAQRLEAATRPPALEPETPPGAPARTVPDDVPGATASMKGADSGQDRPVVASGDAGSDSPVAVSESGDAPGRDAPAASSADPGAADTAGAPPADPDGGDPEPATTGVATTAPQEEASPTASPPTITAPVDRVPPPVESVEDGKTRIRGRLTGPAAGDVLHVILLGPNNILREARRLRPVDGRFEAIDLAPGRYRIQLDAGGDRVVNSEPPFVVIDVEEGRTAEAEAFRVSGVY